MDGFHTGLFCAVHRVIWIFHESSYPDSRPLACHQVRGTSGGSWIDHWRVLSRSHILLFIRTRAIDRTICLMSLELIIFCSSNGLEFNCKEATIVVSMR